MYIRISGLAPEFCCGLLVIFPAMACYGYTGTQVAKGPGCGFSDP
jgi:hypothetical protein